ncbi:MAG TPA: NADP-dependent oxidoreductase [Actinopolymorphaceae bacterium]
MSRALVFSEYGPPEVLRVVGVDAPHARPGRVRVRVRAAGVQPFDCDLRAGRTASFAPARFPQRLGTDFAGVIDEVGEGVEGFAVGDEVLGYRNALGTHAEHVVVPTTRIVPVPAGMSLEQAGVLAASAQTALTALDVLGVSSGDVLLLHGAGGGVGTYAGQIARARGATVIGTASPGRHHALRSLGTTPVAYGDGLVDRVTALAGPAGVSVALDCVGSAEATKASLALVADRTRIGTIADQAAAEQHGFVSIGTVRTPEQLLRLVDLYVAGRLRIDIDSRYPWHQAALAHRRVESGHVRGKVVLTLD